MGWLWQLPHGNIKELSKDVKWTNPFVMTRKILYSCAAISIIIPIVALIISLNIADLSLKDIPTWFYLAFSATIIVSIALLVCAYIIDKRSSPSKKNTSVKKRILILSFILFSILILLIVHLFCNPTFFFILLANQLLILLYLSLVKWYS